MVCDPEPAWIIGDVHGHYDRLIDVLRQIEIVDETHRWQGHSSHLWFVGDFTDRGPDGLAVIDLVMRLQREAADAGGLVQSLLGNHDVLLVAARRFGDSPSSGSQETFLGEWRANGGIAADLTRLTGSHVDWITQLPAMALVSGRLLLHADAMLYTRYGHSIEAVNASLRRLLTAADDRAWDRLLGQFAGRHAFVDAGRGVANARALLERFGGSQIVHGHTPISLVTGVENESVSAPLIYAEGLCVNVDGGMYLGGPGFAWRATVGC